MKNPAILMVPALLLALISWRVFPQQPNNTPMSFTGEIMDNECAAAGTHDGIMRKQGFETAKACALGCLKAGGQFVLFALNKTTYRLDDQEKPVDYAGQKVTIIGTYDGATKTIHVQSMQAVP